MQKSLLLLYALSALSGCLSKPTPWQPGDVTLDGGIDGAIVDGKGEVRGLPPDVAQEVPDIAVKEVVDTADVPDAPEGDVPADIELPDAVDAVDAAAEADSPDVCVPDCEGRQCGDNGCGGNCGECGDGNPCTVDSCGGDGLCDFVPELDACAQWVLYRRYDPETQTGSIWAMTPDGEERIRLTDPGGGKPKASPDGSWLLYVENPSVIRVAAIDGGDNKAVQSVADLGADAGPDDVSWKGSDCFLFGAGFGPEESNIFEYCLQVGIAQVAIDNPGDKDTYPAVSPAEPDDVVYQFDPENWACNKTIRRHNLATGEDFEVMAGNGMSNEEGAVSRHGDRYVWVQSHNCPAPGPHNLYVMDLDTYLVEPVTAMLGVEQARHPQWSPDDNEVWFTYYGGAGGAKVCRAEVSGQLVGCIEDHEPQSGFEMVQPFPFLTSWDLDWDSDGVGNGIDNCPDDVNTDQLDFDGDGAGDECDDDDDGDTVPDDADCESLDPEIPSCDGLDCGDDGCGGSCGDCTSCGEECVDGACAFTACDGKQCGSDSCDGTCGLCEDAKHEHCSGGLCVCKYKECLGACCAEGEACSDDECCPPDCAGKECGDDGCSGVCGECAGCEEECDLGLCEFVGCDGKECGPDGCGGTCGELEGDCLGLQDDCIEGACICAPDCVDKQCGDDGCSGSCGECGDGNDCQDWICWGSCGDGVCGDGETCVTCIGDCGPCEDDSCHPVLEKGVATGLGSACVAATVEIPAGIFWMGCNNWEGSAVNDLECSWDNEVPIHELYMSAYEIDLTEVTADQYKACVADGGACPWVSGDDCPGGPPTYGAAGKGDHPVNCVDWEQANAYCEWAGKRLCTEAQWEKAARGGCEKYPDDLCKEEAWPFPWGNDWAEDCGKAVHSGCGEGTQAVAQLEAGVSPYGIYDMSGNVAEWVKDWFDYQFYLGDAYYNPEAGWNKWETRIVRGGGFEWAFVNLRVSQRGPVNPDSHQDDFGFRCCFSACVPDCEYKNCGSDGCDSLCGDCPGTQDQCVDGNCQCQPDCEGKECGDDGCGGDCGECEPDFNCYEGSCCAPDCLAKNCGNDGCGGSCGECDLGESCDAGQCKVVSWTDSSSGLTWENPPPGDIMTWLGAHQYCDDLALGGCSDWRLPNIDELRSLIRDCPAVETGGSCNLSEDDCLAWSCRDETCDGCSMGAGPADGTYWPDEMQGGSGGYWSSSTVEDKQDQAWYVSYFSGRIDYVNSISASINVRCAR